MLQIRPRVTFMGKDFIIEPYSHEGHIRARLYRIRIVNADNIAPFELEHQIVHPDLDREWKDGVACMEYVTEWLRLNNHKF